MHTSLYAILVSTEHIQIGWLVKLLVATNLMLGVLETNQNTKQFCLLHALWEDQWTILLEFLK